MGIYQFSVKTDIIYDIQIDNKLKMKIPLKSSTSAIWTTIRKHTYSKKAIQALCELVDNSITSINEKIEKNPKYIGKINIVIDFKNEVASIEDNGTGFSNDVEKLSVAWSYGCANPHGLSEHGCGTKSALSIFDMSNSKWKCSWKNGDGKVYMVKAPLSDNLERYEVPKWDGIYTGESGVFIEFPFPEECSASLYAHNAKNKSDVEQRCYNLLSQMYMDEPHFKENRIEIYLNEERVNPLVLSTDDVDNKTKEYELPSTKGKVVVRFIVLKNEIKNTWFVKTQTAMGIYISKNGRHIQHVSNGDLFETITGRKTHPSFACKFILISLYGDQSQLPSTDPTKSTMNETDRLFSEMCSVMRDDLHNFYKQKEVDDDQERDLVLRIRNIKQTNLAPNIPGYEIHLNKTLNSKTPPIDIVEVFPTHLNIYEAKKDNKVSIGSIIQLYGNYLICADVSEKPIKNAILLIKAEPGDKIVNEDIERYVQVFKKIDFPLQIHNFDGKILWSK